MAESRTHAAVVPAGPRDRLGRPLRDLRISVIDRCNFRCPYCMPADRLPRAAGFVPAAARLTPGEIERLARAFVALGVVKLRLTGGEPLLRSDLPEIVARLSAIDGVEDLALTTNGTRLAALAPELKRAGLGRITVSLDALDPAVFRRMSGGHGSVEAVLEGIAAATAAGFGPVKINTVVMRAVNESEVLPLLERFRGTGHIVRLIEFMDVGTCNAWRDDRVVTSAELLRRIARRWPLVPLGRRDAGEVAERYAYADGQGEIGVVSSISRPFCGDCHRARLAADGTFYTCLFASRGTDLGGPLRAGLDDAALRALLAAIWNGRADRYSELRAAVRAAPPGRVEMYRIGG